MKSSKEVVLSRYNKYISINPYTGQLLEEFETWDTERIRESIRLSAAAYKEWRGISTEQRKSFLTALSAHLRSNVSSMAQVITDEMGKPIAQSKAEILKSASLCDYYSQHLDQLATPRRVPLDGRKYGLVVPQPQGAVLGVMPWNFPVWQAIRFAVPVLCGGNVVLLKHAQNVGMTANLIEEAIRRAAGMEGVLINTFVSHEDAAIYLEDDHVIGTSLTGSEKAGVAIGQLAGKNIKKSVMELGGSDAFVVLYDADIQASVEHAVRARLNNNGQTCIAAKRFFIDASISDKWTEAFVQLMGKQKVGDPNNISNDMSGLARPDLAMTLSTQVEESVYFGAKKLLKGGIDRENASVFHPEVLTGIADNSPLAQEETFGPVASLFTFDNEDEMLRKVNASRYGLGASIWSGDTEHAIRVAEKIEAGSVAVNQIMSSDPRLPFGGIKKSGFGREMSAEGFFEFVNLKTIIAGDE